MAYFMFLLLAAVGWICLNDMALTRQLGEGLSFGARKTFGLKVLNALIAKRYCEGKLSLDKAAIDSSILKAKKGEIA